MGLIKHRLITATAVTRVVARIDLYVQMNLRFYGGITVLLVVLQYLEHFQNNIHPMSLLLNKGKIYLFMFII